MICMIHAEWFFTVMRHCNHKLHMGASDVCLWVRRFEIHTVLSYGILWYLKKRIRPGHLLVGFSSSSMEGRYSYDYITMAYIGCILYITYGILIMVFNCWALMLYHYRLSRYRILIINIRRWCDRIICLIWIFIPIRLYFILKRNPARVNTLPANLLECFLCLRRKMLVLLTTELIVLAVDYIKTYGPNFW